ncbi:MAG: hypothetical protein ACJBCI_00710 [Candidatus Tisiphia sp.]
MRRAAAGADVGDDFGGVDADDFADGAVDVGDGDIEDDNFGGGIVESENEDDA